MVQWFRLPVPVFKFLPLTDLSLALTTKMAEIYIVFSWYANVV
jgi:hypothetical protein